MEHIILASASPRRKEIFALAGLDFEVVPSEVEEIVTKKQPEEVVMELSSQKAWDVWQQTGKRASVVGADTIVAYEGKILGKPRDKQEAAEMLHTLSGKTHQVYTGVTFVEKGEMHTFYEETKVTFYPLSEEDIVSYVKSGEPMDKAGAYGIQGKAAVFIKGIEGDYYNVVGFPIARFLQEIKKVEECR